MSIRSTSIRLVTVVAVLAMSGDALAQPIPMGNRCFTQTFWCWLPSYGPVGYSCFCGTPYGPVPGFVGQ